MTNIIIPTGGQKISMENGNLTVPDNPIIPFIEGDGIGPDIWAAAVRVFDAAVEKAYNVRNFILFLIDCFIIFSTVFSPAL